MTRLGRSAALCALLAGAASCRACDEEKKDRGEVGKNLYEGEGPARLRFPQLRVSGSISERATVTVNGAPDLDGTDDRAWAGQVGVGPDALTEAFAANAGTATISVEVRAQDGAGNTSTRRYRIRVSAE